jgi:DNA modification methylase
MAPELARALIQHLPPDTTILDPMAGSGVVLRQAVEAGQRAIGCDIDPLAVLMSRAWISRTKANEVLRQAIDVAGEARRSRLQSYPEWILEDKETRQFVDLWFEPKQRVQLARLASVLHRRRASIPRPQYDMLALGISKIIITKQRGASVAWDTSHSRPHRKIIDNDYEVIDGFLAAIKRMVALKDTTKIIGKGQLFRGDARDLSFLVPRSVGAIITSPPYLNAIDYLRGHRLALVWLGYTVADIRVLRNQAIGSERRAPVNDSLAYSREIAAGAVEGFGGLQPRWQSVIVRFVNDTQQFLSSAYPVLRRKGRLCLITADSNLRGARVQTAEIFRRVASDQRFQFQEAFERPLDSRRRYLPIDSASSALNARMRTETVQIFRKL